MSYKLTEETKQWIVSNYTAVGIIEAMERVGGEKALDIAKGLATTAAVVSELMTNPGRIKFVGDEEVKPVETIVEEVKPVEPVVEVTEPVEPVVEVTEPVVEEVKPVATPKAKTTKKK